MIEFDSDTPLRDRIEAANEAGRNGDTDPLTLTDMGLPDDFWRMIEAGPSRYRGRLLRPELPTFWISRYPITQALYREFVAAGGYIRNEFWTEQGIKWRDAYSINEPSEWFDVPERLRYPVVNISWHEAVAFTQWLGQLLNLAIRLPLAQEWEKAACGPEPQAYPWGPRYECGNANVDEANMNCRDRANPQVGLCPVGLYPWAASPYGVEDVVGNIWEWCFTDVFPFIKPDILLNERVRPPRRNCWYNQRANDYLLHGQLDKAQRQPYLGFRVVATGAE